MTNQPTTRLQDIRQAGFWDQADADGIVRRTYRTSGHRCPLCEGALEPELEDYDLFSGRLPGLEVLCDNCPALYEIVNSDPLELKRLDHPDSQAAAAACCDALPA